MSENTPASDRALGLTPSEAHSRLATFGPNEIRERETSLGPAFLAKLWAPVPWMLEATILLELLLGKRLEATIIAALLLFNAALSLAQERRAGHALSLLRRRLSVDARVLRDGAWQTIPARELVPGDVVHLRMGDLVPADIRLGDGVVQIDQSVLTGRG
jgi:H+-transporting ATPase